MEQSTLSVAITLFLIMDPLGNLPIFISILQRIEPQRRRRILVRELIAAFLIMQVFLLLGNPLLRLLGLRQESVSIAGGIVLFLISLRMIFPTADGVLPATAEGEPFIVPIAIPLIAGPSLLASLILIVSSAPNRMFDWYLALTGAWLVSSIITLSAPLLQRVFRVRGLIAIERLMGMILVAVAVQMFLNGLAQYLKP